MNRIGLVRERFYPLAGSSSQASIDGQLQAFLQVYSDDGATIISAQETRTQRKVPGNMDTDIAWTEFLIISSHPPASHRP